MTISLGVDEGSWFSGRTSIPDMKEWGVGTGFGKGGTTPKGWCCLLEVNGFTDSYARQEEGAIGYMMFYGEVILVYRVNKQVPSNPNCDMSLQRFKSE